MTSDGLARSEFRVGGPVPPGAATYVERAQDAALLESLAAGKLCVVLGAPGTGKTSMAGHVAWQLEGRGVTLARVVAPALLSGETDAARGIYTLAYAVAEQLEIGDQLDAWWTARADSLAERWTAFLVEYVGAQRPADKLAVVIDDCDQMSGPIAAAFGAGLRAAYPDPSGAGLGASTTLGVCAASAQLPAWALLDAVGPPRVSGAAMVLRDFTEEEVVTHLAPVLKRYPATRDRPAGVLEAILHRTGGHPGQTIAVLAHMLASDAQLGVWQARQAVARAIAALFWDTGRRQAELLLEIESAVTRADVGASALDKLDSYQSLLFDGTLGCEPSDPIAVGLQLTGLVTHVERGGRWAVRVRPLYEDVFGGVWAAALQDRLRNPPAPRSDHPIEAVDAAKHDAPDRDAGKREALSLIETRFCGQNPLHGPYRKPHLEDCEELVEGKVYRCLIYPESRTEGMRWIQICCDLGEAGGEMWHREYSVLRGLAQYNTEYIPELLAGRYIPADKLAFFITDAGVPFSHAAIGGSDSPVRDRRDALRQLTRLARGIVLLQRNGFLHRNLSEDALEVVQRGVERNLRLARFESSTLIRDLLSRGDGATSGEDAQRRRADARRRRLRHFQGLSPVTLACSDPERIAFMTGQSDFQEGAKADVFSLGMLAFRWLVRREPLPAFDPVHAALQNGRFRRDHWDTFHGAVLAAIEAALGGDIPRRLAELLRGMLAASAGDRMTAEHVVDFLGKHENRIQDAWSEARPRVKSYLIGYEQDETWRKLHEAQIVDFGPDPNDKRGALRMQQKLYEDLEDAVLTYHPDGALAVTTGKEDYRHATTVLVGKRMVHFAQWYRKIGTDAEDKRALMIRHSDPRSAWDALPQTLHPKDTVPEFRLAPRGNAVLEQDIHTYRSWESLIDKVKGTALSGWPLQVHRTFEWLFSLTRVRVEAQCYPVTVVWQEVGDARRRGQAKLRLDDDREDEWCVNSDPLRALFCKSTKRRPPWREFFTEHVSDPRVDFRPNYWGWEDRGEGGGAMNRPTTRRGEWFQLEILGEDMFGVDPVLCVAWAHKKDVKLPEKGWIQPREVASTLSQLKHQRTAQSRFTSMGRLLRNFEQPEWIERLGRDEWGREISRGLEGNAHQVLLAMLDNDELFALHGPPGTGKTTIAARAVKATLERDPNQRILVAAQSHYALDNLADKMIDEVGDSDRVVAIRVASYYRRQTAAARGKARYADEVAAEIQRRIIHPTLERLTSASDDKERVRTIVARWREEAKAAGVEIRRRVERSANLVFATTGGSTDEMLQLRSAADSFDWVIVEEVARAWPTELAMPLVHGRRWTLIGDHHQLPPFGRSDIERILDECEDRKERPLRKHYELKSEYVRVFDLFEEVFKRASQTRPYDPSEYVGPSAQALIPPAAQLGRQFRMREPIGSLISEVFYDGKLDTGDRAKLRRAWFESDEASRGVKLLDAIRNHSLIWIDVDGEEQPCWYNKQEAAVVAQVVKALVRTEWPDHADAARIAVLSPYRAQRQHIVAALHDELPPDDIARLERLLRWHGASRRVEGTAQGRGETTRVGWEHELIHTVDSFQGREADLVVVSLVRNNNKVADRSPASSSDEGRDRIEKRGLGRLFGFVSEDERANVLLSRARCGLVLVGSWNHFRTGERRAGVQAEQDRTWERVCKFVEDRELKCDPDQLGLNGGG